MSARLQLTCISSKSFAVVVVDRSSKSSNGVVVDRSLLPLQSKLIQIQHYQRIRLIQSIVFSVIDIIMFPAYISTVTKTINERLQLNLLIVIKWFAQ